jgi:hypothetical protein
MYIKLLAAFLFAYYFVNVALLANTIKKYLKYPPYKRLKPLDCVTCLSFWVACVLYFLPIEVSQFIIITFGAGFIGTRIK